MLDEAQFHQSGSERASINLPIDGGLLATARGADIRIEGIKNEQQ
jgi:hypothetical protein